MGFVKQRKALKVGVNWSIDARIVVKLEDIAISRKAKLSPIVQEILELGIESYEAKIFAEDLKSVKKDELSVRRILQAKPRGDSDAMPPA